jgi:hypothetical protein
MERTAVRADDNRACVANFSTKGEFMTGKQFRTFEDFSSISKAGAFDSLVATIASTGYQITSSSKDSGIISANQAVTSYTGKSGKTVPLNAVITTVSGKTRVELVFTLSGGLATSADALQEEFCRILSTVSSAKESPVPVPLAATESDKKELPQTKQVKPTSKKKSTSN